MNRKHVELHVFLNEKRIGTLSQDNDTMSFAYVPEYLQSPNAYPLSQSSEQTRRVSSEMRSDGH